MGVYGDFMGFVIKSDLFDSDLMGFYSAFMGFYSDSMGFYSNFMGYEWEIPSGNVKVTIETGPFIESFPIRLVIFHSYVKLPRVLGFYRMYCIMIYIMVFNLNIFLDGRRKGSRKLNKI